MDLLTEIENSSLIKFPKIYRDFHKLCENTTPKGMIGSDLINKYRDINTWAKELLEEDEVENFLEEDDFVFLIHQGYQFWYFKANGNKNPKVYFYYEGQKWPKEICSLKEFIENYPNIPD